jgi:hypothetical protein
MPSIARSTDNQLGDNDMTFATELEQLLEKHTTLTTYPKHGEPQLTVREFYTCDVCGQGDEEAWAIAHSEPMCRLVQEALLDG